jgi:membrane protease YdiL (CAAX protease family)
MEDGSAGVLREHLGTVLFFGAAAAVAWRVGASWGFFSFPHASAMRVVLPLRVLLQAFAIYLGVSLGLSPLLAKFLAPSLVQPLALALTLSLLFVHARRQDPALMRRIWKDPLRWQPSSAAADFGLGALSWLLSFPLVVAVGQLCDLLVALFAYEQPYEQVAVRYLKTTMESPFLLATALFTILIAAPAIEEFLFRGLLQTYVKRYLGGKAAILLAALCFALFHFSPSQGLGNLSLLPSLFAFACFLGFLYERQGSLFASIGLHMTFNGINSLRILIYPES